MLCFHFIKVPAYLERPGSRTASGQPHPPTASVTAENPRREEGKELIPGSPAWLGHAEMGGYAFLGSLENWVHSGGEVPT